MALSTNTHKGKSKTPKAVKAKGAKQSKSKVVPTPREKQGTYKYDRDARIQVCVEKNPKREGSKGFKMFEIYRNGITIREFLEAGGRTIDIDWDRERGFIATEDRDKEGMGSKTPKATFTL